MILFWLRKLSPKWLIPILVVFFMVGSGIFLASGISPLLAPEQQLVQFMEEWNPSGSAIAHEIEIYRGCWTEQFFDGAPFAFMFQTILFGIFTFWRVGVVVLIWIAQMVFSPIWLVKFRYGPLAWLWRSLAYWKRPPMLR